MAVTKLCEKCDKAVTIFGFIEAQSLHSGGQFVCASCRRKAAAGPTYPVPGTKVTGTG